MKRFKSVLILISILLIPIGCSKLTPEELITSAKQNIEQGELQTAVVELKNAISQNNALSEARALLGSVYLQQSQFEAAEKELLRAADMGAPYADVYPYLIKVYYYQEDFEGAISLADRIMLVVDDEVKSTLFLYQYLSKLRIEKRAGDMHDFPESLSPNQKKIIEAYNAFLSGDDDQALESIASFNYDNSDKVAELFITALVNNRLDKLEQAANNFRDLLKEYPNYHFPRFLLIDMLVRDEKLDEAEEQTDIILAINKDQGQANYYKGLIAFKRDDFENAFMYSQKATESRTEGTRNYLVNGLSGYRLEKFEQAYSSLSKVAPFYPLTHIVHRIIAQIELNLGYTDAAAKTLSSLEGISDIDVQLLEESVKGSLTNNEFELAAKQFSTLNKYSDSDARSEFGEGLSKIIIGDLDGINNIQKSITLDPSNDQAWLYLAEVYLSNNKTESVVELAQKWQETNKVAGLVLEGQARLELNEPQKAIALFSQALEIEEFNVPALINLIRVLRLENNYSKASEYAFKALNSNPKNTFAAKELILIAKQSKNYVELQQFFENLVQEHAELEEPMLMLASIMRAQGENIAAIELLEKNRDKLSDSGLMALGDALYNEEKYEDAKKIYLQWIESSPRIATPWFRLIGLESAMGNIERARKTTTEALKLFPNSEPLRLANLKFMMSFKEYAAARDELKKLRQQGSKNAYLNKAEGQLALIERKYERAASLLKEDYENNKSYENAINLTLAYVGNKQKELAKEIYEEQLTMHIDSLKVKYLAAEFMGTQGYDLRAIELYHEIINQQPDSSVALNNLSNAYLRTEKYSEALAFAEQAVEKNQDSPQIMDTYGWALFKAGKVSEAKSVLAVAYNKSTTDADIGMNYIDVLFAVGELSEINTVIKTVKPSNTKQQERLKDIKSRMIQTKQPQ